MLTFCRTHILEISRVVIDGSHKKMERFFFVQKCREEKIKPLK